MMDRSNRPPVRVGGRYRLRRKVGSGGLADVWAAWDERLKRTVAVKLFRAEDHSGDRQRFDDEVGLLASLDHPHLVRLHDAGDDAGHPWAVMPLLTGGTLERPAQPLDRTRVLLVVADVAAALAYIHERGIIHRDVKPSNVLLDEQGRAHLADFGIARMLTSAGVTLTGTMIGTPAYLSPEQVAGEPVGAPADVYSLGLVLLECLTGHREYPGGSAESAVARLSRAPHPPGDLDPELTDLVLRMTARLPPERPTAEWSAHRLWEIAGPDATPGTTRVARPTARRRRRLGWALAAGAAALAATAGLSAAALWADHRPPAAVAPPGSPQPSDSAISATSAESAAPGESAFTTAVTSAPRLGASPGPPTGTPGGPVAPSVAAPSVTATTAAATPAAPTSTAPPVAPVTTARTSSPAVSAPDNKKTTTKTKRKDGTTTTTGG